MWAPPLWPSLERYVDVYWMQSCASGNIAPTLGETSIPPAVSMIIIRNSNCDRKGGNQKRLTFDFWVERFEAFRAGNHYDEIHKLVYCFYYFCSVLPIFPMGCRNGCTWGAGLQWRALIERALIEKVSTWKVSDRKVFDVDVSIRKRFWSRFPFKKISESEILIEKGFA